MKKLAALLLLILLVLALVGCGSTTSTTNPSITPDQETNTFSFPEVKPTSENLDVYRRELKTRDKQSFISNEEWETISQSGVWSEIYIAGNSCTAFNSVYKEATTYYYPVVYSDGDFPIMWYTDDEGCVKLKALGGQTLQTNFIGKVDIPEEELGNVIDRYFTFSKDTFTVSKWEIGEKIKDYKLPNGSEYCGYSFFEGYIFRSGTDVYSLEGYNHQGKVVCIAHNVQYVVEADYKAGSDPWSQPLFLMTDGSLKTYISWEGTGAVDDASHLVTPKYEGGYK